LPNRRVLHAADIHLDSPLQKLNAYEQAPVDRIRGASRRALENLVALAIQQEVDLVVIAGDLYDGDWPDQNTGLFFVEQARRLIHAGIPLAIIRGNHDAANVMTSTLPLPKNPDGSEIMMRSEKVDSRDFEDIGITVHGQSFQKRAETANLAARYPAPHSGMFNLGLLHTSLTGAEGHEPYAPTTPAELIDKGYDYWALGHVHTRASHGTEDSAPIHFSGNLQGRHIRECGPKGCLIVDIDSNNRCTTEFHPLDVVRWYRHPIDVSDIQHTDEVADSFQQWLGDSLGGNGDQLAVVRVELTGDCPIHDALHQKRNRLWSDLQSIAIAHGHGSVWLENLKVHTTSLARSKIALEDGGPLQSLATVVQQLKDDNEAAATVQSELNDLARKLQEKPFDIEPPLNLDDDRWVNEIIDSASSYLFDQLSQHFETDSRSDDRSSASSRLPR